MKSHLKDIIPLFDFLNICICSLINIFLNMTNTNTIFTVGIYCLDKMSNLNSMKIQQINLKFKKGSQPPNFSISPQKLIEAAWIVTKYDMHTDFLPSIDIIWRRWRWRNVTCPPALTCWPALLLSRSCDTKEKLSGNMNNYARYCLKQIFQNLRKKFNIWANVEWVKYKISIMSKIQE